MLNLNIPFSERAKFNDSREFYIKILQSGENDGYKNLNCIIIVVDDSSDLETRKILAKKKIKNLKYFNRGKKGGRGSAVIAGMNYALENFSCRYLIEMDADLSHEPKEIISNLNFFFK